MKTLDNRRDEIEQLSASGDLNQATARLQDLARDFAPEPGLLARTTALRKRYNLQRSLDKLSGDDIGGDAQKLLDAVVTYARTQSPPVPLTDLVCVTDQTRKQYRGSTRFQLQPINLNIRLGEITALVGENGNGKSTVIKLLAAELAPTSGAVTYPCFKVTDGDRPLDYYGIKRKISYVPQELPIWTGSTRNNLLFTGAAHGLSPKANLAETDFIISRLGLDAFADAAWHELSGGYKMRFSLARALISSPSLLLLDEPLASLDVNTQLMVLQDLRNIANSLARPVAIVVSSQHLHEIESIADRLVFLKQGKTVYYGSRNAFGTDRRENVFELTSTLTAAQLAGVFAHVPGVRVEPVGANFMVRAPIVLGPREFLQTLLAAEGGIAYFRDISQSTRKLFELGDGA